MIHRIFRQFYRMILYSLCLYSIRCLLNLVYTYHTTEVWHIHVRDFDTWDNDVCEISLKLLSATCVFVYVCCVPQSELCKGSNGNQQSMAQYIEHHVHVLLQYCCTVTNPGNCKIKTGKARGVERGTKLNSFDYHILKIPGIPGIFNHPINFHLLKLFIFINLLNIFLSIVLITFVKEIWKILNYD